jgi:hypothetical protein
MKKLFVISGVLLCVIVMMSLFIQGREKRSLAVSREIVNTPSVRVATSVQEIPSAGSLTATRSWLEGSQSKIPSSESESINTQTELTRVRSSLPRGFVYTASSSQDAPPELRDYGAQFFALTSEYVVVADEERAFMAFKDSNLIEAAKFFSLAGTRYEALATKLAAVKAPRTLEVSQKKLVSIYRTLGGAYHTLSKEAQDRKISNEALTAQAYAVTSTAAPLSSILTFLYSYGITQP